MAEETLPARRLTDEEFRAIAESNRKSQAQELAAKLVPKAVETLEKVLKRRPPKGKASNDSAKVNAAKLLIETAEGKPTQRLVHEGQTGGITVNIMHFETGEMERVHSDAAAMQSSDPCVIETSAKVELETEKYSEADLF